MEKRVQKLEKSGQEEKHGLEMDTNSRKNEDNVLDVEQCQRRDLLYQGQSWRKRLSCK